MCETVSSTFCKIYLRPEPNRLEIQVEADTSPTADFWQMYDELQARLREKCDKGSVAPAPWWAQ